MLYFTILTAIKKLAHIYMNERQLKKYRKNEKTSILKSVKSNNERQKEFKNREIKENKIRKCLYISNENIKKIDDLQKIYLKLEYKKISKSEAINILLGKI
jgi:hypothetical protein